MARPAAHSNYVDPQEIPDKGRFGDAWGTLAQKLPWTRTATFCRKIWPNPLQKLLGSCFTMLRKTKGLALLASYINCKEKELVNRAGLEPATR